MFGDILYKRLPEIYHVEDENLQLKKFLNIIGVGMDEVYTYTDVLTNSYDPAHADPSMLLPSIAQLGYHFPYSMSDEEKRNLIKMLPILYKYKGTTKVIGYMTRLIFGENDMVNVVMERGEFELNGETVKGLIIDISYEDDLNKLTEKLSKFNIIAEDFRPINTRFKFIFAPHYTEVFVNEFNSTIFDTLSIESSEVITSSYEAVLLDITAHLSDDVYDYLSPFMDEAVGFNSSKFVLNNSFVFTDWINPFTDTLIHKIYETLFISEVVIEEDTEIAIIESEDDYITDKTDTLQLASAVNTSNDFYIIGNKDFLPVLNTSQLNSNLYTFLQYPDEFSDTLITV